MSARPAPIRSTTCSSFRFSRRSSSSARRRSVMSSNSSSTPPPSGIWVAATCTLKYRCGWFGAWTGRSGQKSGSVCAAARWMADSRPPCWKSAAGMSWRMSMPCASSSVRPKKRQKRGFAKRMRICESSTHRLEGTASRMLRFRSRSRRVCSKSCALAMACASWSESVSIVITSLSSKALTSRLSTLMTPSVLPCSRIGTASSERSSASPWNATMYRGSLRTSLARTVCPWPATQPTMPTLSFCR